MENYITFEKFYQNNPNLFEGFDLSEEEISKIVNSFSNKDVDIKDENNEELVSSFRRMLSLNLIYYREAQRDDVKFEEKLKKFKMKDNKSIKQREKMIKEIEDHISPEEILKSKMYGFFKNVYSGEEL